MKYIFLQNDVLNVCLLKCSTFIIALFHSIEKNNYITMKRYSNGPMAEYLKQYPPALHNVLDPTQYKRDKHRHIQQYSKLNTTSIIVKPYR